MKIAILTQPLHNNYGGLLQAFALQKYLINQGHDVLTVDFKPLEYRPKLWGVKGIIKNVLLKYFLRKKVRKILPLTAKDKAVIGQHTSRFVKENIRITRTIDGIEEINALFDYKFDAYVIGSDQVWRPAYSPCMPAFFLSFLHDDGLEKRISYAASFGVDNCDEFSASELEQYAALAKKFDAISVREDSAVALCLSNFGVKAEHVLDPTMLLPKESYIALVEKDKIPPSDGNMMVYVLDRSGEKAEIINRLSKHKKMKTYTVMPDDVTSIYPPVTQWLRGFMDAEFVVTDSFHGVAFSIIFNKPFIAIGNHDRGLARFTSILKKFKLENRLIFSLQELTDELMDESVDFAAVEAIKDKEIIFAKHFLCSALDG